MQDNFDLFPEVIDCLKLQWPKDLPLNICVRCRDYDYTGKSKQETIAHIESCMTDPMAPAVMPIQPKQSQVVDPALKIPESKHRDDQPPRPIFQAVKMKHTGTQEELRCNKTCADDRVKLQDEILELKYQNSRLRDDMYRA